MKAAPPLRCSDYCLNPAFASAASNSSYDSFEFVAALSSLAFAPPMDCCRISCLQPEELTMSLELVVAVAALRAEAVAVASTVEEQCS